MKLYHGRSKNAAEKLAFALKMKLPENKKKQLAACATTQVKKRGKPVSLAKLNLPPERE